MIHFTTTSFEMSAPVFYSAAATGGFISKLIFIAPLLKCAAAFNFL